MSNSAKQREFFDKAIKTIENLGCKVTVERNKHFKAKISYDNKVGTWGVSTTPSNRFSAQRAAISDLKKILREIGIDLGNKNFNAGMLHMQITGGLSTAQLLDSFIEKDPLMSPKLFNDLLNHSYPNLTSDNQAAILSIGEVIPKIFSAGSIGNTISIPDWSILDPHRTDNNALENLITYYTNCQKITKLGVLITNVWSPSKLFSFAPQIEHFETRWIQSVVILISANDALPISWPWR